MKFTFDIVLFSSMHAINSVRLHGFYFDFRCVKATKCNKPITPNPSGKSGLPADLALYDG